MWPPIKHGLTVRRLLMMLACVSAVTIGMTEPAVSAEVPCRFKSNAEPVDIKIIVRGEEYGHATIQKDETKQLLIPEGPFTVVSKVYNANLKAYEDVLTDAHTRLCLEQVALSVPLFSPEP